MSQSHGRLKAVQRRLYLVLLLALPCIGHALSPAPVLSQEIIFESQSATLTASQRHQLARLVQEARIWQQMRVTVSTEASRNDNIALRQARIDIVVKQLQAEGVFPSHIAVELIDYDAIRDSWLRFEAQARVSKIPLIGPDLTQRSGIKVSIRPD